MRLLVEFIPSKNVYKWSLWDGPDGIDYESGEEDSLGETFERVTVSRFIIGQSYAEEDGVRLAKPEHWLDIEKWASSTDSASDNCFLELKDRVKYLERTVSSLLAKLV